MLPGRGRNGRGARMGRVTHVLGVRVAWTAVGDGEFFCPGCGGDRNYQRLTGRRRLTLVGVPLLSRGAAAPVVECASCRRHFGTDALNHPTTTRFSAMLRDAVHAVALAVLAAGGACSRTTLRAAVDVLRSAGFEDCTGDRLGALAEGFAAGDGRACGAPGEAGPGRELHEALGPLAPHLAPAGREALLLRAARIALADGPYTPAERDVLAAVGSALTIHPDDVPRLLEAARTPS
ncbi:TerB family tellurite resistance protein [Streptomyces sp. NPDC048664]|uniref:TerB family tellurite resistance protein n=1 Tax=Streptomyces sp. NPDC048664 TaxID=3154505 RepID=UPI003447276D